MKEESVLHSSISEGPLPIHERLSWRVRFAEFVRSQEANRFLWMIVSLITQCCIVTPAVLGLIFYSGPSLFLLLLCAASVMLVFVVNLAMAPVAVVLPAFALSLATEAAIVIFCLGRIIF